MMTSVPLAAWPRVGRCSMISQNPMPKCSARPSAGAADWINDGMTGLCRVGPSTWRGEPLECCAKDVAVQLRDDEAADGCRHRCR